jgi:putative endonuclease
LPYYVYILANRSHTTYVGVTNDLEYRVRQHKAKAEPTSFTARYNVTRLVYYGEFSDVRQAIEWEKRIKGRVRAKKVALIVERNKYWRDLAADWDSGQGGSGTRSNPQAVVSPAQVARGTRGPSLRSG